MENVDLSLNDTQFEHAANGIDKDKEKTLSQLIADKLAEEIVLRNILPGTHMDEQSLADRFKVSRSPVRDALRQLAATHLVQYKPRKGFYVSTVKASELQDLFEASGEIEALCARLCALRASPTERMRLESVYNAACESAEKGDTARYAQINDEFHKLIYISARNSVLKDFAILLRHRLAPFRARGFFKSENRMDKSNHEHKDLLDAILSQNADDASKYMLHHATNSAMNVLQHFDRD